MGSEKNGKCEDGETHRHGSSLTFSRVHKQIKSTMSKVL